MIVIGSSHDGVEVIGNVVQARVDARRGGDFMVCMAEGYESVGGGVKRSRHDNDISRRWAGYNEWLRSVDTHRKEGEGSVEVEMVQLGERWSCSLQMRRGRRRTILAPASAKTFEMQRNLDFWDGPGECSLRWHQVGDPFNRDHSVIGPTSCNVLAIQTVC